jgi:large subunit ribosomal protein L33
MAKTKNAIKMLSEAGTGKFYVTKKNPKNNTKKLELKKYDAKARKHVKFKETKLK